MYIRETIIHYTCDFAGCNVQGKGNVIPKGWTRLQIINPPGKDNTHVPALHALLCPDCSTKLQKLLMFVKKEKDLMKEPM